MSIRFRILLACLGLTFITVSLGLYAQRAQRQLGELATQIYDETLVSTNRLRMAQSAVAHVDRELARPRLMAETLPLLSDMLFYAYADFEVAQGKARSKDGRAAVAHVDRVFKRLMQAVDDWDTSSVVELAEATDDALDGAIKVYAADGYRYRQDVGEMVRKTVDRTTFAIVFAFAAALAITVVLSRSIVPALRDAVRVAQSIAGGCLTNAINGRGRSETAALLRALSAMQASIAESLDRIKALLAHQTRTHAGELAVQHTKLEAALDNMGQGLCMFGPDDRLMMANRRFGEMFGSPRLGATPDVMLEGSDCTPMLVQAQAEANAATLLADGRTIAVTRREMAAGGWVATFEDVSDQRAADAKLAHMARHDALTGLPNRLHFTEHMSGALARARRAGSLAVLCLDLDRFKVVNDTMGLAAGDALLQAVAGRLSQCTRETDLVARLGADEFAIIQEPLLNPGDAGSLASRITHKLSAPFDIDGQAFSVGVSIGIALSDGTVATSETLLKCADLALQRAKHEGRGGFCFFEAGMDAELQARRELELDLRRAVQVGEFEVFYQPLIAAGRGISGFEALVRWRHPVKGLISPALFIPVAEEMGIIGGIGAWVLNQAIRDAASWPGTLKVAVNLSPVQFQEDTLVRQVTEALAAAGLPATRLELEITESVLMQEDARAVRILHELRTLGVRIAMDDFGTGYSSLSYLRRFPFDKIKIDQSFVRGMNDSPDCGAIIRAVIGLGRSLNMAVNAEGVETDAQLAALQLEGCNEMQGYLFSRPLPESEVTNLLLRHGNATLELLEDHASAA